MRAAGVKDGRAKRRLALGAAILALVAGGVVPARGQQPVEPRAWEELSPEQRARAHSHYERFRRLPENRRRVVEERYRQWQSLPPQEQQRVRRNYESYRSLNPEQRREFQEKYRRWRSGRDPEPSP